MIVFLNKHETRRQRSILQKFENSFYLQAHHIIIYLFIYLLTSDSRLLRSKS